jgi:Transposase IS4
MEAAPLGVSTTNRKKSNDDDSDDDRIVFAPTSDNEHNAYDDRDDLASEFEPADTDDIIASHVDYVQYLLDSSQLHIIQPDNVKKAYKTAGVLGLFHLFITSSWFESMRVWTNKRLISKGKKVVSKNQFRAYVGLELAMSIIQMNNMRSFWQSEMFTGHLTSGLRCQEMISSASEPIFNYVIQTSVLMTK